MAARSAVVSDSSPLIALERIRQIELLKKISDSIVIPGAVATEVFGSDEPPVWIRVEPPRSIPPAGMTLGSIER